ncbi:MAG: GNAT family N-acetyltransferase [Crocinitomicaceae bacterium]|nr:GNAT family N-acetyltransferase [Crocinitomicaceae bacterium]
MSLEVRIGTEEDVPAILNIINHEILNSTSVYDYEPKTIEEQLDWFTDRKKNDFPVIVAVENGEVLGYGSFGTFRQKAGYKFCVEHSIYINEKARGKGIGKRLLTELINIAKASGMHTMVAGIDSSNTGSMIFHEQFGFIKAGTLKEVGHKFDTWLDVTFMQLIL